MYRTAIQKRAAQGATFLDKKHPGWHNEIELGLLDVANSEWCMLGQLYGDYGVGTQQIRISQKQQYRLGFMAIPKGGCGQYPQLTAAWKTEILNRIYGKRSVRTLRTARKPKHSAMKTASPTRS